MNPALVLPDKEGKPYTVHDYVVNVMLLNEVPERPPQGAGTKRDDLATKIYG